MPDETKVPDHQPDAAEVVADQQADHAIKHALGESLPVVDLPDVERDPPDEGELADQEDADSSAALRNDNKNAEEPYVPPIAESARNGAPSAQVPVGENTLVLEKKHPVAIRWMHWINFPVLFTMIWSGLLIYWNDSDNAYKYPHEVYRVGIGHVTLFRFFPPWFYTNHWWDLRYKVTTGLGYHFFFMWLFAINGVAYVAYLLWSREWRFMVPHKESIQEAIQVTLVDLHLRKGLPRQTKYNGAQRIAYSSVIVMGFGSLVTGLAIYKPTETHWLTSLLGGYEMARWLHFWLTIGFCAFFLVHVGQVILAGWNNFRSMVSGYEIRRADEPSIEAERNKR